MILVRSPLRISLAGGGTDLPSHYRSHGGQVISAAISNYIYISINKTFDPGIFLKYSKLEKVDRVQDIQHPIFREALKLFKIEEPRLEITSMADIPSGTGLGSSGAFTVGLIRALNELFGLTSSRSELAEIACKLEIETLMNSVGKQDQYAAAFGGISKFTFSRQDEVTVDRLNISQETINDLQDNLALFYTGISRSSTQILQDQHAKSLVKDENMTKNLLSIAALGIQIEKSLINGNLTEFAHLMNEHWEQKRRRTASISSLIIDDIYRAAMENGALGGKLIGAGGGGFLMFYCQDKTRLTEFMKSWKLKQLNLAFDFEGVTLLAI
jgi:D-glycero-alpha-D-manno-heptose-7-phosphate kinase